MSLNSENISRFTEKETQLTGEDRPIKDGPTARAQSHAGETINSQTLRDITEGEKKVTGGERVKGGPTAEAQSILTKTSNGQSTNTTSTNERPTGKLDSSTISNIAAAEKDITGSDNPVRGGPTAHAQKHANEAINSNNLHDITQGERKITGQDGPVKDGPTATAQSAVGRSRS